MQLAQKIGKPYREGFVKNRYVGRTFIMPGQGVRKKSVRQKLNAIGAEFKGRNVLLVDDSIVRGTTSKEIVQMAREAGARKVYMASRPRRRCAIPTSTASTCRPSDELIAHGRSVEEIRQFIGADALIYQDVDAMKRVVKAAQPAAARRLRGLVLRRPLRHRRRDRRRLRGHERSAGRSVDEDENDRFAPRAAERDGGKPAGRTKLPRVDLPADARLDTLAVREGLPPHASGARTPRRCSSPAASCIPMPPPRPRASPTRKRRSSTRASRTPPSRCWSAGSRRSKAPRPASARPAAWPRSC